MDNKEELAPEAPLESGDVERGADVEGDAEGTSTFAKTAGHVALSAAVAASMSAALNEPPNTNQMHLPDPVPIVQTYEQPETKPQAVVDDKVDLAAERRARLLRMLRLLVLALAIVAAIVFGVLKGCTSCTATMLTRDVDRGSDVSAQTATYISFE